MNFVKPAGNSVELPKEAVDRVVNQAVEKSKVMKLVQNRGNVIEVLNEGSIPVYGNMALDKIFRLDSTADVTSVAEQSFSVQAPTLNPVEVGTYTWLSKKAMLQYPDDRLDVMFEGKLSDAMARKVDQLALSGDETAVGATNALSICDGLYTIAKDATQCKATPVSYSTSESAGILDAVNDAVEALELYSDAENAGDLVLFAGKSFTSALRKNADRNIIGYEVGAFGELGLSNVGFAHGVPVIKHSAIGDNDAVLVNMKGLFYGYRQQMTVESDYIVQRRATLIMLTFHIDLKWAFLDDDAKAVGIVLIEKSS
jgi:hypothetical protein